MNKLILLSLLIFLAFATSVNANLTLTYNKTTNTLGNSIWNETWTTVGNKTFYVNLPKNATVSNTKLNLSGYQNLGVIDINFVSYVSKYSEGGSGLDAVDLDNNTYTIIWNYPDGDNAGNNNWTFKKQVVGNTYYVKVWSNYGGTVAITSYFFNYTSNSWTSIGTSGPSTSEFTGTLSSDFVNASGYTIYSESSSTGINGLAYFYTIRPGNDTNPQYPTNPYLNVSGDGDTQWSFSGSFNQTNNQTSDFSSEINSYLKTCYPYIDGTCDVPFILHSDSAGIMKVQLNATITYDSQTFDSSVFEGQNSNFWIKVNSTSDIQNVNAWLVYNGTSYAYTTKQQDGSYWTFTKSLTIPSVNADTNINFYWNFTYSNATNTYAQNFSSYNQTVYRLSITNCTSGNFTLNFTGYDEETKNLLGYSMDAAFTYWPSGKTFTKNLSVELRNNNTYYFCIAPSGATIYFDATIKYWNSSYTTRYYYLTNATLTNSTQNINLYLLNSSSSTLITINILDQLNNPQTDVVVMIEKQNIGNDSYSLVAETKTDYSGNSYAYLKLGENYKVLLISNGIVLREYNPFQLQSTSLPFYISQSTIPEYFSYIGKVATSCNLDNSTNALICNYIDTSGLTMDMTLKVTQITQAGDMDYCLNSSSGASGTFVCNLASNYSYKYSLTGTYYSTPTDYLWQSGFANLSSNTNLFGEMGLIISLIFIIFMPFLANWDVRIALLLQGAGVIISLWAGFIFGGGNTQLLMILVAIIEGVVIYKVKTP
jgi:hypothetical protein